MMQHNPAEPSARVAKSVDNMDVAAVASEILAGASVHRAMASYAEIGMLSYLLDLVVQEARELLRRTGAKDI